MKNKLLWLICLSLDSGVRVVHYLFVVHHHRVLIKYPVPLLPIPPILRTHTPLTSHPTLAPTRARSLALASTCSGGARRRAALWAAGASRPHHAAVRRAAAVGRSGPCGVLGSEGLRGRGAEGLRVGGAANPWVKTCRNSHCIFI